MLCGLSQAEAADHKDQGGIVLVGRSPHHQASREFVAWVAGVESVSDRSTAREVLPTEDTLAYKMQTRARSNHLAPEEEVVF